MTADIAIVGPTASGKTALCTALARQFGDAELVSVDAMAVYRGLDIGTAKPTTQDRVGLRWHLIDVVDPDEEFSVAQFQSLVSAALYDVADRSHRSILVGGTGLYHRAIIDELDIPGRYPEIFSRLQVQADSEGLAPLYAQLVAIDPLAATRTEPTNARRILRALEVTLGSGRPFSSFGPGLTHYGPSRFTLFGLELQRYDLDERIEQRLDRQLASGFVEEVRGLLEAGIKLSRTARQALGYRELISFVEGTCTLDEARTEILGRTKQFARRQIAWFRRDPRIIWLDARQDDLVELVSAHCRPDKGDAS